MDWERLFRAYEDAWSANDRPRAEACITEARTTLQNQQLSELDWLLSALAGETEDDDPRRNFIKYALSRGDQMPVRLFEPMLRAGVYEENPSFNRGFLEPCVRCFGARRVNERLLDYFQSGTDREKAGAASAFYWTLRGDGLDDIVARVNHRRLAEFVANDDLEVRRRIVPGLRLDPELYPKALRPLIPQAIALARAHHDDYIRHRIEIQLGAGGPYKAIPVER